MKITTGVIHLKNAKKDANGLENVIFATESQISVIVGMRNDPEKRLNFVKIGNTIFSPMDVSFIETKEKDSYDLPKYFLERRKKESSVPVKIN